MSDPELVDRLPEGRIGERLVFSVLTMFCVVVAILLLKSGVAIAGFDEKGVWQIVVFSTSLLLGGAFWYLLPWRDNIDRFTSFGACVLLAWVANRLVWMIDFWLAGERFTSWEVYQRHAALYVFQAEIITVAGTVFMLLAWYLVGGTGVGFAEARAKVADGRGRRVVQTVVAISLLMLLLESLAVVPSALAQFLFWTRMAGLASLLLLALTDPKGPKSGGLWLGLLSLPYVVASLDDSMKESIIQALLPIGIFMFLAIKKFSGRVMLLAVAVVVLGVITAFVQYSRVLLRETGLDMRTNNQQITLRWISDFASAVSREDVGVVASLGVEDLLRRANTGNYRGYAVAIAENEGFQRELVFGPAVYALVPRVLWPDKPNIVQAEDYNVLLYGRAGSSMSTGLFAGAYMGGGWLGVLLVAGLLGAGVAGASRMALRFGGSSLCYIYSLTLIPIALRIDEAWAGPSIAMLISSLVYPSILFLSAVLIERALPRRQVGCDR